MSRMEETVQMTSGGKKDPRKAGSVYNALSLGFQEGNPEQRFHAHEM